MTSQWSLIFVVILIVFPKIIGFSNDDFIKSAVGYGGPIVSSVISKNDIISNNNENFSFLNLFSTKLNNVKKLTQEPIFFLDEALAVGRTVFPKSYYSEEIKSSEYILPARGWNWGILHDFNAVDIADACGKPIYASYEGLVIEESDDNFWNNGYGNYILIEHPNNTKTRYAHTLKNLVKVGDYVLQGQQIALIGNSGNTHGLSGCHLHFEVYGAKNPFAIR